MASSRDGLISKSPSLPASLDDPGVKSSENRRIKSLDASSAHEPPPCHSNTESELNATAFIVLKLEEPDGANESGTADVVGVMRGTRSYDCGGGTDFLFKRFEAHWLKQRDEFGVLTETLAGEVSTTPAPPGEPNPDTTPPVPGILSTAELSVPLIHPAKTGGVRDRADAYWAVAAVAAARGAPNRVAVGNCDAVVNAMRLIDNDETPPQGD